MSRKRKLFSVTAVSGGRVGGSFWNDKDNQKEDIKQRLKKITEGSKTKDRVSGSNKPPSQINTTGSWRKDYVKMKKKLDKDLYILNPPLNKITPPSSDMFKKSSRVKAPVKKSPVDIHQKAQKKASLMNKELQKNLSSNERDFGFSPNAHPDGASPVMPTSVESGKRTLKMASNVETRVIHRTNYTTGYFPTKPVREAAKMFGTAYLSLFDSKIAIREVQERNTLTGGAGFNSRHCHVPCFRAQLSRLDVNDLIQQGYSTIAPAIERTDMTARTKTLAAVIRLKRQFMIHNTSSFFPMSFRICIGKMKEGVVSGQNYLSPFFNACLTTAERNNIAAAITANTDPNAATFAPGRVPWFYQHGAVGLTGASEDANRQVVDANFSLKSRGFSDSTIFRKNYDILETFEKTIPPGDFWNFSHVHNCGGGIDLAEFFNETTTNEDKVVDPFTTVIWFETKGTLCEGILLQAGGRDAIIGTSPTYYTYEYKTSAYYVKSNVAPSTDTQTSQLTSPVTNRVYRREYISDPQLTSAFNATRQEVFVPNGFITTDPNTSIIGEMYIPIASASAIRYQGTAGGSNVG